MVPSTHGGVASARRRTAWRGKLGDPLTSTLRDDTDIETRSQAEAGSAAGTVDYDVHGLAGIRLVDASPCDVAAVTRQVGPMHAPLAREPEIVIRFVDRLPLSSRLRYLGLDDAAFTDDAFLLLQSKNKARVRAQVAFEGIGTRCELVCETGVPAVPALVPIVNLTVLAKGWVPVHASAFTYAGTGVLATGWAKGGKTEALLAFMAHGAGYVGDEWVYVSPDGERLCGLPEPIKIWEWHLPELPRFRALVSGPARSRWKAIKAAQAVERALPDRVGRAGGGALSRVMPLLERQLFVHVPPEELFGRDSCALAGRLDRVFLLVSHETPDVRVERVAAEEVARRMVFSLQHERLSFLAHYHKFRFAFPEAANALIDGAEERERVALAQALAGKDAHVVYHPFPAPIPALFEAMRPLLEDH
jgi:hypothetical protein